MTAVLESHAPTDLYPVLNRTAAFVDCVRCCRQGRAEWLANGTVRVLHHGLTTNYVCVIQVPLSLLPGVSEVGKALLLLR